MTIYVSIDNVSDVYTSAVNEWKPLYYNSVQRLYYQKKKLKYTGCPREMYTERYLVGNEILNCCKKTHGAKNIYFIMV